VCYTPSSLMPRHPAKRSLLTCRALLLGTLGLLWGCDRKQSAGPPAPDSKPAMLEIQGFNYTDLYIDTFEVNGRSGGNLLVSDTLSGGGGGVCCVTWSPDTPLPVRLTISWTRENNRRCEQDIEFKGPVPPSPRHLGIHFYPDGHIEAEITQDYPEVRLSLERFNTAKRKASGNTVADEQVARCQEVE
jgi:hypothetical protein